MKELTDLPIYDIWPIIFRNLSISDLLNCRLVSKKFKEFSDKTNGINKLIVGHSFSEYAAEDYYWFYNNRPIEDKQIISLKCFRSIKLLSIFNLNKNLKYLKILDDQLELEELSNLINLESIEIGHELNYKNQQITNLNNLKVLLSTNQSIQLNTPKLEKIQFYYINKIQFNSNLESIKHLVTTNYQNELNIFKNLEIMELIGMNQSMNMENLLNVFKNLKQLKMYLFFYELNYSNEEIKNSLIKILNDKIKLRREIDIYLEGVKIENIGKLNELEANYDSEWEFKLNNYDQLDLNLSSINYLEYYEDLERCVNNIKNDLPSSFFDKFQNIIHVYVDKVVDVDGLNWFLNNLKYLTSLTIKSNVSLDEVFYNNLPSTIRFLTTHDKNINYDFILKLSKLIEFYTEIDKDLFDLAFKSFSTLKYLQSFEFYFKGMKIEMEKDGKYFYLNNSDEKLDYNQLIIECNKIRSK